MYTKFCETKKKGRGVWFWRHVLRPIVFQQCAVSANDVWRENFLRLVHTMVPVPECTLLTHLATHSGRPGYGGVA